MAAASTAAGGSTLAASIGPHLASCLALDPLSQRLLALGDTVPSRCAANSVQNAMWALQAGVTLPGVDGVHYAVPEGALVTASKVLEVVTSGLAPGVARIGDSVACEAVSSRVMSRRQKKKPPKKGKRGKAEAAEAACTAPIEIGVDAALAAVREASAAWAAGILDRLVLVERFDAGTTVEALIRLLDAVREVEGAPAPTPSMVSAPVQLTAADVIGALVLKRPLPRATGPGPQPLMPAGALAWPEAALPAEDAADTNATNLFLRLRSCSRRHPITILRTTTGSVPTGAFLPPLTADEGRLALDPAAATFDIDVSKSPAMPVISLATDLGATERRSAFSVLAEFRTADLARWACECLTTTGWRAGMLLSLCSKRSAHPVVRAGLTAELRARGWAEPEAPPRSGAGSDTSAAIGSGAASAAVPPPSTTRMRGGGAPPIPADGAAAAAEGARLGPVLHESAKGSEVRGKVSKLVGGTFGYVQLLLPVAAPAVKPPTPPTTDSSACAAPGAADGSSTRPAVKLEMCSVRFSMRAVRSSQAGVSHAEVQRRMKAGDEVVVVVAGGGGAKPIRLASVEVPHREQEALDDTALALTPSSGELMHIGAVLTAQGPDGTRGFTKLRTADAKGGVAGGCE